jgi:hypothetical protein
LDLTSKASKVRGGLKPCQRQELMMW